MNIGAVYGELAVIDSGITEGDILITVGARDLVNGESIEVMSGMD